MVLESKINHSASKVYSHILALMITGNGLSQGRYHAITQTNAGNLLIECIWKYRLLNAEHFADMD